MRCLLFRLDGVNIVVGSLHLHIPNQNLKWRFALRFNGGDFPESVEFLDSDLITHLDFKLGLVGLFLWTFLL